MAYPKPLLYSKNSFLNVRHYLLRMLYLISGFSKRLMEALLDVKEYFVVFRAFHYLTFWLQR